MNGKRLDSRAASNPMMKQIANMIKASMTGDIALLGRGWETEITDEKGNYCITINPTSRRTKRYASAMTMLFNTTDMTLEQLRMEAPDGSYTQYEFVNKKINAPIDPATFEE